MTETRITIRRARELLGEGRPDRADALGAIVHENDAFGVRDVVASYNLVAHELVPEYERHSFEDVHAPVLDLIPDDGTGGGIQ